MREIYVDRIGEGPGLESWVRSYLYDLAGHLLAEYATLGFSSSVVREYIWLGDTPVAMVDHTMSGNPLLAIHTDHLGRPQKMTDASQAVVWGGQFDPFGEEHAVTGATDLQLRFPGQEWDAVAGISQNWNRDYDPTLGRYIESDPMGLRGGMSTYAYAMDKPLKWSDPLGLAARICSRFWHPHTFLRVDGNCSGKYPSGNPFWSPGDIRDDSAGESSAYCSDIPPGTCDQQAFDRCIADQIAKRGPSGSPYNFGVANCGLWAEEVIQRCRDACAQQ